MKPPKRLFKDRDQNPDPPLKVGDKAKLGESDAVVTFAEYRQHQGKRVFIAIIKADDGRIGALRFDDDGAVTDLGHEYKKYIAESN